MNERFGKAYKLCSKKIIEQLYQKGAIFKNYPLLLRVSKTAVLTTTAPFQVVISVPKRKFKKAIDRNYLKRLMREGIRKNKYILEKNFLNSDVKLALFLTYVSSEKESYQMIAHKIEILFHRLVEQENSLPTIERF